MQAHQNAKPDAMRLADLASALSLTHYQDLSYRIFELEDLGLPQQGILLISARKTITMANHRCLEKDSPHCVLA